MSEIRANLGHNFAISVRFRTRLSSQADSSSGLGFGDSLMEEGCPRGGTEGNMKQFYFCLGLFFGGYGFFQLMVFIFAFFPATSSVVDQALISYLKDVVGPIITGLGGAGLGALAAYKFQQNSADKKEFKESIGILRLVKLQLITKMSELASLKKQSILPYEDFGHRFISIGPLPETPGVKDSIDQRIFNMLADVEAAEVIQELMLGDQRYFACFENFKERNKALYAYREKIDEAGLNANLNFTFKDMISAVEPGRILAMYTVTENLLLVLDEAIASLDSAMEQLGSALDKKFSVKGAKKITFVKSDAKLFEALKPPRFSWDELDAHIRELKATA